MTIEKRLHRGAVWPLTDADYEKLDPGIRRLVQLLVENDFETTDSGDGKTKLAEFGGDLDGEILDTPHVFIGLDPDAFALRETDRIRDVLRDAGVPVEPGDVQLSYDPADESCIVMVLGIDDSMLKVKP